MFAPMATPKKQPRLFLYVLVTRAEKTRIERAAAESNLRSVAEYVRKTVLDRVDQEKYDQ